MVKYKGLNTIFWGNDTHLGHMDRRICKAMKGKIVI